MAKQVRSSSRYVLTTEANVLTAEGTSRVARTTQQTQTAVRAPVSIPGLADPAARALSLTTPPPSPPRPAGTPACDPTQGTPASMDDPLARCDCDCHGYESSAGIMRPAYDAMKIGPGFLQCEHIDGANGYPAGVCHPVKSCCGDDSMMAGRRLDYEAAADATVAALEDDNELKETVEETVEEKLAALAAKNSALEAKFAALEAKLMHMAA